jgi:hypothetical protein
VHLAKVSRRARITEAIRYALKLWSKLSLFLDDAGQSIVDR